MTVSLSDFDGFFDDVHGENTQFWDRSAELMLCSIVLNAPKPSIQERILNGADPSWFYYDATREIWEAMREFSVWEVFIEDKLLANHVERSDKIVTATSEFVKMVKDYGYGYKNWTHWAKLLRTLYIRRESRKILSQMTGDATESQIEQCMTRIKGLGKIVLPNNMRRTGWSADMNDEQTSFIPTGFKLIDELTGNGGVAIGQTTVIKAGTGVGKTWIASQASLNMMAQGKRVFYATLYDLNSSQIKRRMISQATGWSEPPYGERQLEEYESKKSSIVWGNLYFYDASESGSTRDVNALISHFEDVHQTYPFDVMVVDYIQKLDVQGTNNIFDRLVQASSALRDCAGQNNIAIIALSQVSTTAEGASYTKGGYGTEEDAGLILELRSENKRNPEEARNVLDDAGYPDTAVLIKASIEKNRMGKEPLPWWWVRHPSGLYQEMNPAKSIKQVRG